MIQRQSVMSYIYRFYLRWCLVAFVSTFAYLAFMDKYITHQ